jgi:DNA-directed RNA polymerase subunit RPC12/RpoP
MEKLDGNAAAGMLSEVFALEVSGARGRCSSCGDINALGKAHAYLDAPGCVIRCPSCESVLLVLVRGDGRYWLGAQGMTWIEMH